jgi:hypothetical protein
VPADHGIKAFHRATFVAGKALYLFMANQEMAPGTAPFSTSACLQ